VFYRALDDSGPEFWHFVQEVGKFQDALSAKYDIPLCISWSRFQPFNSAVTDTLGSLGLPDSFREFFIGCLWGEKWVFIGPSARLMQSRVAGFSQITISFGPYDSQQDIDYVLS